ncbi:hypothetical protein IHV25_07025 [Phaeovibrio sulfidiphilus]|uniref:Uncharacterized protein n=1 Tax=Phaeovibrio sulfidiphilus TaxID=1220600 RepID=A0A8J7CCU8_9PROT|nr:hypothetical protein [Phaeovibrio sulfidiphilus]MBE1237398.1 hypothetical protein [Phaeovibrio sulfidiphilus]
MATTRTRIKVSFTDEELRQVDAFKDQVRLSRSELIRRLVLGQPLPNPERFARAEAIRDLLKVNADLARLGNLQKMILTEGEGSLTDPEKDQILSLCDALRDTQAHIKSLVLDLDGLRRRPREQTS